MFQAFNHSREIPITAEHKSILVTCSRSTSSPEEDWQYAVETLRSTSKVTTNDYISLLTPSRSQTIRHQLNAICKTKPIVLLLSAFSYTYCCTQLFDFSSPWCILWSTFVPVSCGSYLAIVSSRLNCAFIFWRNKVTLALRIQEYFNLPDC